MVPIEPSRIGPHRIDAHGHTRTDCRSRSAARQTKSVDLWKQLASRALPKFSYDRALWGQIRARIRNQSDNNSFA